MALPELRARPFDRRQRASGQRIVPAAERRGIVVAHDGDGAVGHVPLDQLEDRDRIGAVADEVAEERPAVSAQAVRVRETRGDRLEVAVDVSEQGYFQTESVFWMR
jgi:hypothetical protein